MGKRTIALFNRLSLAQRFFLASLVVLLSGMAGIGWWVGRQITAGVTDRTAATTALYVTSFISPHLQGLDERSTLQPAEAANLTRFLEETELGQQIAAFKVWDAAGRVVYSIDPGLVGQVFPVEEGLARAWDGEVAAEISNLEDEENVRERARGVRLLEMYIPIRPRGSDRIIAVAEFYHYVDALEGQIASAQRQSWLVVALATVAMYLLLAGLVQRASDTIQGQQVALSNQVTQLTELLQQNRALHERVRRAAARTATVNEQFLRRIGAELHDGPAQEMSLALLRLDHVALRCEDQAERDEDRADLDVVQSSLQHALREMRAISAGLSLPQLAGVTIEETVARVIRAHQRRTSTDVELSVDGIPEQASLPVKITLYRVIQEALTNAYRHAGGMGQQVRVCAEENQLTIKVSDRGPGFDRAQEDSGDEHLGLIGMRERVESLGGQFHLSSEAGLGTTITVHLPLQESEGHDERYA